MTTAMDSNNTCKEVFGEVSSIEELKAKYKNLALFYHPDTGGYIEDFQLLQEFYELAQKEIEEGIYDDPFPLGKFVELKTKKATYKIGRVVHRGKLSDLHIAEKDGVKCVAKVAAESKVNGMLQHEVSVIKELRGDDKWDKYLPEVIDSFMVGSRRVTIFNNLLGSYSLKEILKEYPDGVGGVHFAWMYNRALEILGYVHEKGYIHGAISPRHLLYTIENHGLVLTDWCFATKIGEPMTVVPDNKWSYPPEILEKKGVYAGTDMFLLGNAFMGTLYGLPAPLKGFIKASTIPTPTYRPSDAWGMRVRMTNALQQLYGKPAFVPFTMKEK